jgi:hypothetical protein
VDGVLSGPSVIFPNASLPLDPPPFASFDFNRFLITGPLIPGSPDEGIALFSLEGELTSLNAIPEPTTLLLVGTTMAGLGLARLRRWRQKQP